MGVWRQEESFSDYTMLYGSTINKSSHEELRSSFTLWYYLALINSVGFSLPFSKQNKVQLRPVGVTSIICLENKF